MTQKQVFALGAALLGLGVSIAHAADDDLGLRLRRNVEESTTAPGAAAFASLYLQRKNFQLVCDLLTKMPNPTDESRKKLLQSCTEDMKEIDQLVKSIFR